MMALMVKAVLFGMEKCEVWPEVIGTGKMQTLAPDFHGSIQFASVFNRQQKPPTAETCHEQEHKPT